MKFLDSLMVRGGAAEKVGMHTATYRVEEARSNHLPSSSAAGFQVTLSVDGEQPTTLVSFASTKSGLDRMIRRHFDGLCSAAGWSDAGSLGPREVSALLQVKGL